MIRAVTGSGVDLIGFPRLVRLNPNIPFKTRGNAALAARFGRGVGTPQVIGMIHGEPLRSYPRGRPLSETSARAVVDQSWAVVLAQAHLGEARTEPALVAVKKQLPAQLYWEAVRELVPLSRAKRLLVERGAEERTHAGEGGLVGASAAVAWPGRHPTFELIAYREPGRVGRPRQVDRSTVEIAARRHPELFLCIDQLTRRMLVAPHTDCPILYGLRSTDAPALAEAVGDVESESVERWVIFQTNQATGDHLAHRRVAQLRPYSCGQVAGSVASTPTPGRGGHVRFSILDPDGSRLDCIAFEPTKTLPRVIRSLIPGDRVRVSGGRGSDPVFRVEALEILHLRPRFRAGGAPKCAACRRATRSRGASRGYRCDTCRTRYPPEAARGSRVPPPYERGMYHPTPSARRHLHPRAPEPSGAGTNGL